MEASSLNPSSGSSTSLNGNGNGAAGNATDSLVHRAAQSAHEAIDRLAAKAGPAVEKARTFAGSATESLQARADRLGELEDEWIEASREYVRANPLTAVAVGVLAGVVISKLVLK